MSKIDELIERLCPDGVEFKPIRAVYTRIYKLGDKESNHMFRAAIALPNKAA